MSNINVTKIVSQIDKFIREGAVDVTNRNEVVSSLIGYTIGTQLPLPSSKVKNVRLHYHGNLYLMAASTINAINESYVIDVDLSLRCAYKIWITRYTMVYPSRLDVKGLLARCRDFEVDSRTVTVNDNVEWMTGGLIEDESGKLEGLLLAVINAVESHNEDAR